MSIIEAKNLCYSYVTNGRRIQALKDIECTIEKGELIAVIGKNGCGKSTFAKHINQILSLQQGNLTVANLDADKKDNIYKIRKKCAMVFQNPENQFVSSVVEEDIKFGLRNFNLSTDDKTIENALSLVGMSGFEKRNINTLSGGQKQRIALAGVLAIKPDIIILDEATTMLPPDSRTQMLDIIKELHSKTSITFIMISQYIEEITFADRIILMKNGRITAFDKAESILSNTQLLENAGLKPPFTVKLYDDLKNAGITLSSCPLNNEELVSALCQLK